MARNSVIDDTNPIWWHLGRIVQIKSTRVWETQDRTGIVQYGDSSEEGWTWLTQIEDNGKKKYRAEFENEKFWGRKWKFWNNRRGQKSESKQREQKRSLEDCWQWKANRQCSKGDNCSFRHDMNKCAKSTQPNPSPSSSTRGRMREMHREPEVLEAEAQVDKMSRLPCKDCLKGTCTNLFCEKWHPPACLFYKS